MCCYFRFIVCLFANLFWALPAHSGCCAADASLVWVISEFMWLPGNMCAAFHAFSLCHTAHLELLVTFLLFFFTFFNVLIIAVITSRCVNHFPFTEASSSTINIKKKSCEEGEIWTKTSVVDWRWMTWIAVLLATTVFSENFGAVELEKRKKKKNSEERKERDAWNEQGRYFKCRLRWFRGIHK